MIKKLLALSLLFSVSLLFLSFRQEPKICCEAEVTAPHLVWASELDIKKTELRALTLKNGRVKGKITFDRRRPKQPLVIYLQRVGGELKYDIPKEKVIRQKNARFDPSFMTVLQGQKVVFDNDEKEKINHNVYFLGGEEKDLGVFSNNSKVTHQFDKAGEVEIYCSIHSMMDAKIFVAPNPHHLLLESKGDTFEIKDVPEGRYFLKTYQKAKRFKNVSIEVEVKAGKVTLKDIKMKR